MIRFWSLGFVLILSCWWPLKAAAMHVGMGMSSAFMGRSIPVLHLGQEMGHFLVSGSAAGVATEAYYANMYNLNVIAAWQRWGSGWFGEVWAGIGLGGYYGQKGLAVGGLRDTAAEVVEATDRDEGYGPAFRVEARPFGVMFVAVDFTMGVSSAAVAGGWGDVGVVSLGVLW